MRVLGLEHRCVALLAVLALCTTSCELGRDATQVVFTVYASDAQLARAERAYFRFVRQDARGAVIGKTFQVASIGTGPAQIEHPFRIAPIPSDESGGGGRFLFEAGLVDRDGEVIVARIEQGAFASHVRQEVSIELADEACLQEYVCCLGAETARFDMADECVSVLCTSNGSRSCAERTPFLTCRAGRCVALGACTEGAMQACGVPGSAACMGTQECVDGAWGECELAESCTIPTRAPLWSGLHGGITTGTSRAIVSAGEVAVVLGSAGGRPFHAPDSTRDPQHRVEIAVPGDAPAVDLLLAVDGTGRTTDWRSHASNTVQALARRDASHVVVALREADDLVLLELALEPDGTFGTETRTPLDVQAMDALDLRCAGTGCVLLLSGSGTIAGVPSTGARVIAWVEDGTVLGSAPVSVESVAIDASASRVVWAATGTGAATLGGIVIEEAGAWVAHGELGATWTLDALEPEDATSSSIVVRAIGADTVVLANGVLRASGDGETRWRVAVPAGTSALERDAAGDALLVGGRIAGEVAFAGESLGFVEPSVFLGAVDRDSGHLLWISSAVVSETASRIVDIASTSTRAFAAGALHGNFGADTYRVSANLNGLGLVWATAR